MSRETGTIHHYNQLKGFGFIRREKGKDVFFFFADFLNDITDVVIGEVVEFEVKKNSKGPRAYSINILG
ncbi:retron Se72 family effector protein [Vreelandella maris]|uniref:retron Se72 family effector protein n=1 Tax=Vreelandella maris TaxID=2729617 RepID=UPI0030EB2352|tara:strand:+ start:679 stop:885 length:207 start_codon:yes stop_codon:yes gene_type:complete